MEVVKSKEVTLPVSSRLKFTFSTAWGSAPLISSRVMVSPSSRGLVEVGTKETCASPLGAAKRLLASTFSLKYSILLIFSFSLADRFRASASSTAWALAEAVVLAAVLAAALVLAVI